jgi:trehalose/maltose hydrolase-like predicted phosphorylase
MHYKKELINYLVVINKLGLNFENGDIQIEGDLDAATCDLHCIICILYPSRNQTHIAPMGLSSQGYNGHIFGILNLDVPNAFGLATRYGKIMSDYRSDRLQKAKQKQPFMVIRSYVSMGI